MPRQKRWQIKRQLSEALKACDKAQNYLVMTGKEFEQPHPEYYKTFSGIVTALEAVKDAITTLRESI